MDGGADVAAGAELATGMAATDDGTVSVVVISGISGDGTIGTGADSTAVGLMAND